MARRKKRIEHDNHDRWLISYADFITLLFAFFVVMYSISSVNESKYKMLGDSLSNALSSRRDVSDAIPVNSEQEKLLKTLVDKRTARLGEQQRKIQDRMNKLAVDLRQIMSPLIERHLVNINPTKRGIEIDISASLLFKTGEATLQPAAIAVLREVSKMLSKEELPIEVQGHTDDIPIMTTQFPSNWELSSARASSVARTMITDDVPENRLVVVGLAANQPLVPNDGPENRARNRRVSITMMMPNFEHDANRGEKQ